jgi:orotidine-5'-phosphate decarboxylase
MNRSELVKQIKGKQNYLCVGLDTDLTKIPEHLQKNSNGVFEFNKAIIDATKDYCVSYKINTAFYEAMGIKGWEALEQTVSYIPSTHLKIADAKRGDIGSTSTQYAKTFFETFDFDAITVAPYMGEDSIRPFLDYTHKWTIVLALTSNKGALDFEMLKVGEDYVYEKVLKTVKGWGTPDNLMFVVGATQTEQLQKIRTTVPEHFLLVPGVGFQGGSLKDVTDYGLNEDVGLLVNVSRSIIYAGSGENFAGEASAIAAQYHTEMKMLLSGK